MTSDYRFDRPVIILAAPRSGSTLLFESLSQSSELWTIGGESHALFESIHRFNPTMGFCDSNALSAADATPAIVGQIRLWFFQALRDVHGRSFHHFADSMNVRPRLLEKTPKNALRVSLLDAIFPDALFVYLYRNPRENISSIMEAWNSGRFVTYPSLPGRSRGWSLLLPPGWQSYHDASLVETAAFQWKSANVSILQELSKLDRSRWMAVSYGQQVHDTFNTLRRVCEFSGISAEGILKSMSDGTTKLSRYTVSPPAKNKWHKNAAALSGVMPTLRDAVDYIRNTASDLPDDEFDIDVDMSASEERAVSVSDAGSRITAGPINGKQ